MDFKLIGGILLVIGTSVGAGMLGLPIVTAELGFFNAMVLLFFCWGIMTTGAFLLLEANLWLKQNNNIISMAKATIGPFGQFIAWTTYLLLLYSLLCAYIAGGSDLLNNLIFMSGLHLPAFTSAVIFTLFFGSIIYLGIHAVDYTNRIFMLIKFSAFFMLIILLLPIIDPIKLAYGHMKHLTSASALTVTITSFGYATIVPSLRVYFGGDVKKLKITIIIGSLIPLICYILWDAVIMGAIPLAGPSGLIEILHSPATNSALANTLSARAAQGDISFFMRMFTSVCVVTSFLGVALCLTDFLADGLQLEKKGRSRLLIHGIAFIPPLTITLFFPNIFIHALEYAGIYCITLLVFIPAWIVWHGRYDRHIKENFRVPGGKILVGCMLILAVILILWGSFGKT